MSCWTVRLLAQLIPSSSKSLVRSPKVRPGAVEDEETGAKKGQQEAKLEGEP
jgi:hypothetical protein